MDGVAGGDFGPAIGAIFAESVSDLTPSLPAFWQSAAQHGFVAQKNVGNKSDVKTCEAVDQSLATVLGVKVPVADRSASAPMQLQLGEAIKPPRVISSVDPAFTDEARGLKISTNSLLSFVIGASGRPDCIQVVRPAGAGLDEQAIRAVARYRLRPATLDGKPVPVEINVDVNFQIF